MPNPARTDEAKALEVPVTVQGSKIVEGTDHRELFTETTKTEVVFDNGATLNLNARVVAGQSLFLRNEITGREVLCRVMEAPAAGTKGPTDLEFTVGETGFWDVTPEQIQAAAEKLAAEQAAAAKAAEAAAAEKSASQRENSASGGDAHADSTLAMMGATASNMTVPPKRATVQEELMAAHEAAPDSSATPSAVSTAAPHEEIVPAHAQLPEQPEIVPKQPEAAPEFNLKKFEDTLAALLDSDTRRAKRATKDAAKAAGSAAAQGAEGVVGEEAAVEEVVVPAGPTLEQRLTTGKGAVIVGVCAAVVIAVCLGFIWRAVYEPIAGAKVVATSAPGASKSPASNQPTKPATGVSAAVPGEATKAPGAIGGSKSAQSAAKGNQPRVESPLAIQGAKGAAASGPVASARTSKHIASFPGPTGPRVVVSPNAITADSGTLSGQRKPGEPDSNGNMPARIVSKVQPTYPTWAKGLDVDGVVTLDALIDEKGNVTQTKVLSGPRPLQHAAEQAIGLWIFEPARANGKPVGTHMTLTVEFQR
jgi:TonB family protein